MGKIIFIIIAFLQVGHANAQYDSSEVRKMIQNNIVSYHIHKIIENGIDVNDGEFLNSETFIDNTIDLLMKGQKGTLNFNMKQSSSFDFPDTNYIVYEVVKKNMEFLNYIEGKNLLTRSRYHLFPNDTHYLLAVNKHKDGIIFISGAFFRTNISSYFSEKMEKEEFLNYVRFKLHLLNASKIDEPIESKKCWKVTCTLSDGKQVIAEFPKDNLETFTLKNVPSY